MNRILIFIAILGTFVTFDNAAAQEVESCFSFVDKRTTTYTLFYEDQEVGTASSYRKAAQFASDYLLSGKSPVTYKYTAEGEFAVKNSCIGATSGPVVVPPEEEELPPEEEETPPSEEILATYDHGKALKDSIFTAANDKITVTLPGNFMWACCKSYKEGRLFESGMLEPHVFNGTSSTAEINLSVIGNGEREFWWRDAEGVGHYEFFTVSKTPSAELSWERPTSREDGAVLTAAEIKGYTINYSPEGGEETTVDVPATPLQHKLYGLEKGKTYTFEMRTEDTSGLKSELSDPKTKLIGE